MFTKRFFFALLLCACSFPAAASHSFNLKAVQIGHPYAPATKPGAPTGAVYLILHNRAKRADALIAASTPRAKRVELHATEVSENVVRMREVDGFELKPDVEIRMRPGSGQHLMLFGLSSPLKAGERFPMTLQFRSAGRIEVTVVVEELAASGADKAPAASDDVHHHH